jgi:hypothetical protein
MSRFRRWPAIEGEFTVEGHFNEVRPWSAASLPL